MRINYERVAELLQSEEIKQMVRSFWISDMERNLKGERVGISVIALAIAMCEEPGTPLDRFGIDTPAEEVRRFILANRDYVTEIYKRVLDIREFLGKKR